MGDTPNNNEARRVEPRALPTLATSTVEELDRAAAVLMADEPEMTLCEWLNLSSVLLARAKEIRQRVERLAVDWIIRHGPVQVGDMRYTAGVEKRVRCTDASRCLSMVLDACSGDLESVTTHLRSDPWKYGSVRSLLGELSFGEVFVTESKPTLVEGKPKQSLQSVNTRFARTPQASVEPEAISDRKAD